MSRVSADGSKLLFSTPFGGANGSYESVSGIAVDASNNIYIAGEAHGGSVLPTTPGAFQATYHGAGGNDANGFVGKIAPTATTSTTLMLPTGTITAGSEREVHGQGDRAGGLNGYADRYSDLSERKYHARYGNLGRNGHGNLYSEFVECYDVQRDGELRRRRRVQQQCVSCAEPGSLSGYADGCADGSIDGADRDFGNVGGCRKRDTWNADGNGHVQRRDDYVVDGDAGIWGSELHDVRTDCRSARDYGELQRRQRVCSCNLGGVHSDDQCGPGNYLCRSADNVDGKARFFGNGDDHWNSRRQLHRDGNVRLWNAPCRSYLHLRSI